MHQCEARAPLKYGPTPPIKRGQHQFHQPAYPIEQGCPVYSTPIAEDVDEDEQTHVSEHVFMNGVLVKAWCGLSGVGRYVPIQPIRPPQTNQTHRVLGDGIFTLEVRVGVKSYENITSYTTYANGWM